MYGRIQGDNHDGVIVRAAFKSVAAMLEICVQPSRKDLERAHVCSVDNVAIFDKANHICRMGDGKSLTTTCALPAFTKKSKTLPNNEMLSSARHNFFNFSPKKWLSFIHVCHHNYLILFLHFAKFKGRGCNY